MGLAGEVSAAITASTRNTAASAAALLPLGFSGLMSLPLASSSLAWTLLFSSPTLNLSWGAARPTDSFPAFLSHTGPVHTPISLLSLHLLPSAPRLHPSPRARTFSLDTPS